MKLLLLNLAATLAMTGIIWFVQVVHYPLFARVGADQFVAYEALHRTYTGWVVAPLMVAELASALALLVPELRPACVGAAAAQAASAQVVSAWTAAALVALIWLSTALLQIPLHDQLSRGYDPALIARLVATNWIRTIAWTLRSAIVLRWVALALSKA